MDEIITQEQKSRLYDLFEQEDARAEELSQYIDELHGRVALAEKVCYAANRYIKYINSPIALGWDELIDCLQKWTDAIIARRQQQPED